MENVITSLHTGDNRYLIIWGCVTKIKAHKEQWYTLKRGSSNESRAWSFVDKEMRIFRGWKDRTTQAKCES